MKRNMLIKHSKEKFIAPRVTQAVGLELEEELLVGSPGTEQTQRIVSTGHEIGGDYTINDNSYWE